MENLKLACPSYRSEDGKLEIILEKFDKKVLEILFKINKTRVFLIL